MLKDLKKGGKAYAAVLADIDRTEAAISKVEGERAKLIGQLNQVTLTPEKKERLMQFATKVHEGLEEAREDFNLRKEIIDLLDVTVRLIREDGKAFAYITCILYDYEIKAELSTSTKPGFLFDSSDGLTWR
jgi:hypothetical protein